MLGEAELRAAFLTAPMLTMVDLLHALGGHALSGGPEREVHVLRLLRLHCLMEDAPDPETGTMRKVFRLK